MDKIANAKNGERLNQLAGLMFKKSVQFWYGALALDLLVATATTLPGLFNSSLRVQGAIAIAGIIGLLISYGMKLIFERLYDRAETMRRQSVLVEALGWPINQTQFDRWKTDAGKAWQRIKDIPRDPQYYDTDQDHGADRLLEMTAESAFWTRNIYQKVHFWMLIASFAVLALLLIALLCSFHVVSNQSVKYEVLILSASFVLPVIVGLNFVGWTLRLDRMIDSIAQIEECLCTMPQPVEIGKVMPLVSEYNCQVANGFPIPYWFFKTIKSEIQEKWNEHKRDC